MSKLSENLHQDVFDFLPLTFVIDLGTSMCSTEYDKFNYYFNSVEKFKNAYNDVKHDEELKADVLNTINQTV